MTSPRESRPLPGVLPFVIKVIALALVLVGLAVLVAWASGFAEGWTLQAASLNGVLVTVGVVLGAIAVGFATVTVVALWRLMWRGRRCFGPGGVEQLVALGVAALLFPRAVSEILIRPIALVVWLVGLVASHLSRALGQAGPEAAPVDLGEAFDRVFWLVQSLAGATTNELLRILWDLPLTQILLAVAMMALIGQLTGAATDPTAAVSQGRRSLGDWLRAMSPDRRRALSLWIVLIAGAYLSVAAIVTTPWLTESVTPEGLSVEQLQERLEETIPSQEQLDRDFPLVPLSEQDPLGPMEATLEQLSAKVEELAAVEGSVVPAAAWRSHLSYLRSEIDEWRKVRRDHLDRWTSFRADVLAQRDQLREQALGDFRVETQSPMATPERVSYFGAVESWVRSNVALLDRRLRQARDELRRLDSDLGTWARAQSAALHGYLAVLEQEGGAAAEPPRYLYLGSPTQSGVLFEPLSGAERRPTPPAPGSGWGPFGLIARWLLATKSLPLTLIAGMIGFGLLGSAISSFVRDPSDSTEPTRLGEVGGVVIRGVSAALVVFLSVKGGLAMFSSGAEEPDPYVLFFACLVGAVFSERVWLWAQEKLGGLLGERRPESNDLPEEEDDAPPGSAPGQPGSLG